MRKWLPWLVALALLGAVMLASAPGAQARWARCHNFSCVNKKLNQLHREVFKCEKISAVTSYYGYWYGGSGDLTTALDYTESGDSADDYMVVETCGTAKRKIQNPFAPVVQHKANP